MIIAHTNLSRSALLLVALLVARPSAGLATTDAEPELVQGPAAAAVGLLRATSRARVADARVVPEGLQGSAFLETDGHCEDDPKFTFATQKTSLKTFKTFSRNCAWVSQKSSVWKQKLCPKIKNGRKIGDACCATCGGPKGWASIHKADENFCLSTASCEGKDKCQVKGKNECKCFLNKCRKKTIDCATGGRNAANWFCVKGETCVEHGKQSKVGQHWGDCVAGVVAFASPTAAPKASSI